MAFRFADPFEALLDLQRGLDATLLSDWFGSRTTGSGSFPPINAFRKGDDFVLIAEIPGIDKSTLDIEVKHDQVRIRGEKMVPRSDELSVHRRERIAGRFDRVLSVPMGIDSDGVKAEYRDGILAILLPRAEAHRAQSISVD